MPIEDFQGGITRRGRPQSILPVTVVAIMALTVFRWVTLVESPLNLQFDEAQYWDWSRHLAFGYVSKPPLIAWIIWLTTRLFGDGEAGVRAAAPLLHALTAFATFATARKLFGPVPAFWAAIAYATLPSVSYSSLIISTDAILLPFWALALGDWWRLLERPKTVTALRLGLWIGMGLLAKYAMIYFVLCAAVHLVVSLDARKHMSWRPIAMALGVAALIVAPNLAWNFRNGWATFSHTANNADWEGTRHGGAGAALTFLASQLAIFGPVFTGLLVWRLATVRRDDADDRTLLLLSFGVPILVIVTVQALIAGAHMNWAAPAYISLCILISAMAFEHHPRWLATSGALHCVLLVWMCFSFVGAIPVEAKTHKLDIFAKLKGWNRVAALVDENMQSLPGANLLVDERKYAVLFNYYLRNKPYRVLIWPFMGKGHNQFSLTNAVDQKNGQHVLLVSRWPEPNIEHSFAQESQIAHLSVIPEPGEIRSFFLFDCHDLQATP